MLSINSKAKIDFAGNILLCDLRSKTAPEAGEEWIDLHDLELKTDWHCKVDCRASETMHGSEEPSSKGRDLPFSNR
jgi:hypothetical protein